MRNVIPKITLIGIMLLMILISNWFQLKVYAASDAEQLIMILDEYKEDLGDIQQFRSVMNKMYNDLDSAKTVNEELKNKLTEDVNDLAKIEGINPVILNVFDIEFKSQISNLTNETLPEMKEEIRLMKEWADEQIQEEAPVTNPDTNTEPTPDVKPEPIPDSNKDSKPDRTPEVKPNTSVANGYIPKAGTRNTIIVIAIIVAVMSIILKNKYGKFKDIK